jgi:hypothetical protein
MSDTDALCVESKHCWHIETAQRMQSNEASLQQLFSHSNLGSGGTAANNVS